MIDCSYSSSVIPSGKNWSVLCALERGCRSNRTSSGCNTGPLTDTFDTGFVWVAYSSSHCSQQTAYEGLAATTGTYTAIAGTSPSGAIAAAVVAFKPAVAILTTAQPIVNIIQ